MERTSHCRSRPARGGAGPSLVLVALLTLDCVAAEVIPPKPAAYFNDYAGVVSASTAQRLNKTLEDFEKSTSSQIVVAVFQKMQSDSSLEDYAHRIFEAWGPGQKDKNNGAILLVFVQDRRMRIEVGYGLEGALPDVLAKRIIEEEIAPFFKQGNYDRGLTDGVTALLQATRGEYKGTGRTVGQKRKTNLVPIVLVFIIILLLNRFVRSARGTVYHRRGSGSYGGWRWSGGWAVGGGRSGGGGGGGSSGGVGASGSW